MEQQLNKTSLAFMATLLVVACSQPDPEPIELPTRSTFVGSVPCARCHQIEFDQWQGSHHQLAMQVANKNSILGDFSGQTISYFDSETTFFQREGAFYVNTRNAAGDDEDFEIMYTFGVEPLQQYLVNAAGGRKQALQFAWDARPAAEGGQRWYHLYPDEHMGHGDPLHWTGRYFNWNFMCAECHSTNVQLRYDIGSDTFDTTFTEISVGCEACHGPGSSHVEQANNDSFDKTWGLPVDLDDRSGSAWIMNMDTGSVERTAPNTSRQQPESCGRCHARRTVIASKYEYGAALTDTHVPELLEENLYHTDGRIQDEVYVYGSFIQSKMYAAGVTCSDCHNPHSGRLHAGSNPNDTCAQCHLPEKFATADHSRDDVGDCVSCHMPATTYMGIDARHDHSFRLPNTATDSDHYGHAIAAGRGGAANRELFDGIVNQSFPPIARATMLTLLEPVEDAADAALVIEQVDNIDPLIRIATLRALRRQTPELRMHRGSHLLRDPNRSVRIEAALTYVEYRNLLPADDARAFSASADEYRTSLLASAFMPDAALRLAEFESRLGNTDAAAIMYEHTLKIGRDYAPVQHAYGLHRVRSGQPEVALDYLRHATEIEPQIPRYAYVYGVALNSLGQSGNAVSVLTDAHHRFRDEFYIAWALVMLHRDRGDYDAARSLLKDLRARFPGNASLKSLDESLDD